MIDPDDIESIVDEQPLEIWQAQLRVDLKSGKPGLRTPKELKADFKNGLHSTVALRWHRKDRACPPEKTAAALAEARHNKKIRVARWLYRKGVPQADVVRRTGLTLRQVRAVLDPIRHERKQKTT